MDLIAIIDKKDYDPNWEVVERNAVRAIIKKNDLYAFVNTKYREFKFIGGGIKEGEDHKNALAREVTEETALKIVENQIIPYGKAIEIRKDFEKNKIFKHISHYYICDLTDEVGETNFDDYEAEYQFKLSFKNLKEAIKNNEKIIKEGKNLEFIPWIHRDIVVMKHLLIK
ncbi:MAG: RNA pyrophosphohydrolase [Alphaproteobacteria bacterium ADurb.Bin438]|nr:MAG: RNA pyrophosphohydrolase [Alphaproteobacteria bacterium ADurb.Bin438]